RVKAAIKPLKDFVRQLEGAVIGWAHTHGGIRLEDGSVLRRVAVTRRKVDVTPAVLAKLQGQFGEEGARALVKTKLLFSLGAVKKAARARAPRGRKDAAEAEVLRELEATGAVRLSVHERWSDEEDAESE